MPKGLFRLLPGGLLAALAIVLTLFQPDTLAAHPPEQEGEQPVFTATTQTSADGRAAIEIQEARLDAAYFTANGSLTGLEADTAGLSLATEQTGGVYESGVIYSPLAFTTDIVPLWQADLPQGTAFGDPPEHRWPQFLERLV